MVKAVQFEDKVTKRQANEGRIKKKNKEQKSGIEIEMKKYQINELTALNGKFKKIDVNLSVEEETNDGRSIMVNMKTYTFETLKHHLIGLLEKHELVENVQLVRTAKANTKNNIEADMEYRIDLDLVVENNSHTLKLKCFNSNCRIQIQHVGKKSHSAQHYLNDKTPTRFLAEEVIFKICESINEDIDTEREKEFIIHLKKEIARLRRLSKAVSKNDKQVKCINGDCKYHNSLDIRNTEKYGQCGNCESYEHFNCANIDEQRKIVYQSGDKKYLCTECLLNFPMLALEVYSTEENMADKQIVAVDVHTESDPNPISLNTVNVPIEAEKGNLEKSSSFHCDQCEVETRTKSQLETHVRLQHVEVIKYICQKCEFSCNIKDKLEEHVKNHHPFFKCRKCEFTSESQQSIDVHEWTAHTDEKQRCLKCDYETEKIQDLKAHSEMHEREKIKCKKCQDEFENQKKLEEHLQSHVQLVYLCDICDQQANSKEGLKTHKESDHGTQGRDNNDTNYKQLEDKYNLLKENYERLSQIHKKSEANKKDREHALEAQNEELKLGYEKVKAENIKLHDNLDTQNKLWKIWMKNFGDNSIQNSKEQNKKAENIKEDDEILLIEDEDTQEDVDDEETERIFQKYLKNLKESGFRRNSPVEEAQKLKNRTLKCITCNFLAKDRNQFNDHLKLKHTAGTRENSGMKAQKMQYCHHWNNYGNCTFESRNGRPCKFEHKVAPRCKFDGKCDRKFCMFVHKNQNMTFLLNSQPNFRNQGIQRGFMNSQENHFQPQNNQRGPRTWGNPQRF